MFLGHSGQCGVQSFRSFRLQVVLGSRVRSERAFGTPAPKLGSHYSHMIAVESPTLGLMRIEGIFLKAPRVGFRF